MRVVQLLLLVTLCCGILAGCDAAKIKELTAKVASLEAKTAELEAKNAKLESELADANRKLAQVEEIRKGYEAARAEFRKNLAQLAPLVGIAESPLPSFEDLKDSSWVGKFAPSAEMTSGLKELQNELKSLLGNEGAKPGTLPRKQ